MNIQMNIQLQIEEDNLDSFIKYFKVTMKEQLLDRGDKMSIEATDGDKFISSVRRLW